MPGAPDYAILFEPVRIGPVTARNRFFQVPHCSGLGHLRPRAEAAMRAVKAEGGWAVISTQEAEIDPSTDLSPYPEQRIWDVHDLPALRLVTEAAHAHGALAAIELAHNGHHAPNHLTRTPAMGVTDMALDAVYPRQARAMDRADIRAFRAAHRAAVRRALEAGFDIVYVYAGHRLTLLHQFLLPRFNGRTDEYGGPLENRVRLLREVLEETREEVAGRAAVALRLAVDEMAGAEGMQAAEEGRAVVEMLAELPDLWDVNVSGWENDSATSRFVPEEGCQLPFVEFVKQVTTKPVVGVGRFTSPDLMAALVRRGVLDLIGAARPSIADPFLPRKIEEGRIEEIRECIGCNICVSSDVLGIPIRCTQNPTVGEEWRLGWHPERIAPRRRAREVLVVGGGPAGLECAHQLARRGYEVALAEARDELGGRAVREARLPGLAAWRRVADHRLHALSQRADVRLFRASRLDAEAVLELGIADVFLATGARWRRDGRGRSARRGVRIDPGAEVLTPDDLMDGRLPGADPVLVYDDDQGYLAAVLAEALAEAGRRVVFVTPAPLVSPFTQTTLEQPRVQARLIGLGVEIRPLHCLAGLAPGRAALACVFTGRRVEIEAAAAVLVTERERDTALHDALRAAIREESGGRLRTLALVGDALAPGLIADAVHSGHMAARAFEEDPAALEAALYRREIIALDHAAAGPAGAGRALMATIREGEPRR